MTKVLELLIENLLHSLLVVITSEGLFVRNGAFDDFRLLADFILLELPVLGRQRRPEPPAHPFRLLGQKVLSHDLQPALFADA